VHEEHNSPKPPDFSRVVVCPGVKQPLLCLWADTGKVRWRIPRIWELDRSADGNEIGVTRFGLEGNAGRPVEEEGDEDEPKNKAQKLENEEAARKLVAARSEFDKKFDGYIAAGPIVTTDFRGQTFIAAARVRKSEAHEAVADSFVYEIDLEGQ